MEITASWSRRASFFLGPVLAAILGLLAWRGGLPDAACWTAAVTALCATWWIFEPIPLAASSLIPFAVFPLVGVLDHRAVAAAYGHHRASIVVRGRGGDLGPSPNSASARATSSGVLAIFTSRMGARRARAWLGAEALSAARGASRPTGERVLPALRMETYPTSEHSGGV